MAGQAAMAKPAQAIPADTPTGHAAGPCGVGAAGAPPTLARGVGTAHQPVDNLRRPLERPKTMLAMVAHVQVTFANRT
jgi:hypothetical protein